MATDHDFHREIYDELIRVAGARDVTFYSDIAPLAGLDMGRYEDRNTMSEILGRISMREHSLGHPMLSAVVILMDENVPGDGFFQLARELGLLGETTEEAEREFFVAELQRVYEQREA